MGSEYIGIKYYSDNDLSLGWNLEKSEEIIKSIDFCKTDNNINYILPEGDKEEDYSTKAFISWGKKDIDKILNIIRSL